MSRFTIAQAARGSLPLFVGLCGPSGSGKTFSALRLATGIQRVAGGELAVIDTEANRALHYAERFKFLHLPFGAPFSPDDYWDAIQVCIQAGAKTIVIDSMSHEHEGPGGVLEQHDAEVLRLSKAWGVPAHVTQFPAWSEPKAKRRRLLNNILQVQVNLVLCFRAKRKVKPEKDDRGKNQLVDLGWMPIAGEEYAYEMTALGVLPPGSQGVPDWLTTDPGSEMVTKRPDQFQEILRPGEQLSEAMGEEMARWASGARPVPAQVTLGDLATSLLKVISEAGTVGLLEAVGEEVSKRAPDLNKAEQGALRRAYAARKKELST